MNVHRLLLTCAICALFIGSPAPASAQQQGDHPVLDAPGFQQNRDYCLTGGVVDGAHAHHIFPVEFAADFERAGVKVNDARHGAWWDAHEHLSKARGYNDKWQVFFRENPNASRDKILDFGRQLASEYGLKILF